MPAAKKKPPKKPAIKPSHYTIIEKRPDGSLYAYVASRSQFESLRHDLVEMLGEEMLAIECDIGRMESFVIAVPGRPLSGKPRAKK